MVTVLAEVVNTTRAVVAGPRATLLAWKPCCGLHDRRKAPVAAQSATTVPPDEFRTVPLVVLVPPPALPVPLVVFAPSALLVPPVPLGDRGLGEDDGRVAASLAGAGFAAATVDC
jgi:hypothetical protein